MIALETIAGSAAPGTLYGIGAGPGDVRHLTLRAAGLVASVDVLASFAKAGQTGHARTIVAPLVADGRLELRLAYPVTTEVPVEQHGYARAIAAFYEESATAIARHLAQGRSVGLLSEGDPFLYGSFMHMWRRLADTFPVEVVPGVTGMSGAWSRAGSPIAWGDDILSVLPATLPEETLARRLRDTDAAVIMKVGRHLAKIIRVARAAGVIDRAVLVERATMPGERIRPLTACEETHAPYFSMVLVPGRGRRL